jgi:hypothetical protein
VSIRIHLELRDVLYKHGPNLLEKCGEVTLELYAQIYLNVFWVNIMLLLKDMANMIPKNALTQFSISCLKICTNKLKNLTLSKLKQRVKVINKPVLRLGTSMFIEMKALFLIFSMVNTSQPLCAVYAIVFLLLLIHF